MKKKQFLALALSATMAAGTVFTAVAAEDKDLEGTVAGEGKVQYLGENGAFDVEVPTLKGALDYLLDPAKLIEATNNERYSTVDFTDATGSKTFYFPGFDENGDLESYKGVSQEFEIVNNNTKPINIVIEASIKESTHITMAEDKDFSTGGNLYIGLKGKVKGSADEETVAVTTEGVKITASLDGMDLSTAGVIKWDASKETYVRSESNAASISLPTYVFSLEGVAKQNDTELMKQLDPAPAITLSYTVENFNKYKDGTCYIEKHNYTLEDATDVEIPVTLSTTVANNKKPISKMSVTNASKKVVDMTAAAFATSVGATKTDVATYNADTKSIVIPKNLVDKLIADNEKDTPVYAKGAITVTVTFSDKTTATIYLKR